MAHPTFRFTEKLYSNPLLISEASFKSVFSYLESRNNREIQFDQDTEDALTAPMCSQISGIGVIEIHGPLTYKKTPFQMLCGGCSYSNILEQANSLVNSGVNTIVLDIDSGGGEAYGAFDSANELRKLCDDNEIKLIAYVDGNACSAAYIFTCVADEVVANPYSTIGSIGVLVCLQDSSKAQEEQGIRPIYITAGKEKVPFNFDGTFRESFLSDLQYKVDFLYEAFVSHVNSYTGIDPETIRSTEAKTFISKDALDIGLVNSIMTQSEFAAYVAAKHKAKQSGAM